MINGLTVAIGILVLFAAFIVIRLGRQLLADERADREDRPYEPLHATERDVFAWVMHLRRGALRRTGATWTAVQLHARLAILRAIIEAAQTGPPREPAASPVAAQAAAGSATPPALPPLPPDELDAACTYRDEPPLAVALGLADATGGA